MKINRHFRLVEHLEENIFGDARFERPLLRFAVVLADAPVKFARNPANGRLVADVRLAQPTGSQPTEMKTKLRDHRFFAEPRRFNRCNHAARSAAINADVAGDDFRSGRMRGQCDAQKTEQRRFERFHFRAECRGSGSILGTEAEPEGSVFSGRKLPFSQHCTNPSVTDFNSSQRPRMSSASAGVIWLSLTAVAMTASRSANSWMISFVAGMRKAGCALLVLGFLMKKPPARWQIHWTMRGSALQRCNASIRSRGLTVPLPAAGSGGSAHL